MIESVVANIRSRQFTKLAPRSIVIVLTLGLASVLGTRASTNFVALIFGVVFIAVILIRPGLGPTALVLAAILVRVQVGTGTDVSFNAAFLLVPILLGVWMLGSLVSRQTVRTAASPTLAPLFAFLVSGLLSLLIGTALWDPGVPRSNNLVLVQLTQWAIFAFSAGAYWLAAVLILDLAWLRRLTVLFVSLAGILVTLRLVPEIGDFASKYTTMALIWPPSIMLLTALSCGQLLYNRRLPLGAKSLISLLLGVILVYAFVTRREDTSVWIGVAGALSALIWLRFPRLRWPLFIGIIALMAMGMLVPAVYNFAGGDEEWTVSGGSRLVLIERVVEVAMRNPITGLGPAAYRSYAGMQPLAYQRAYWLQPAVNSHNNYVDLFAHVGLLGLVLFGWFAVSYARSGLRLRQRYTEGFAAGYVNAMLAVGFGSLVLMLFADWMLPHVYNIGFTGFQASVLVWLFMGGLVALDNMTDGERGKEEERRNVG